MKTVPYPHQLEGIEKIQQFRGRALVADPPGLGKSAQAIWWSQKYLPGGSVVVVCPAILKENWRREWRTHGNVRAEVLYGRVPPKHGLPPCTDGVYVVNYDILGDAATGKPTWWKLLKALKPSLIVLDEFRLKIMGRTSKTTKAVRQLCKGVPHLIGLDGTGGMNSHPTQMWPFLNLCRPSKFPSFRKFAHEFGNPQWKPWGWVYNGVSNGPRLRELLKRELMVRRTKEEVLKDLPPKVVSVVPFKLSKAALAEYREAEENFARWVVKNFSAGRARSMLKSEELQRWNQLRQLVSRLKFKFLVEWIDYFLKSTGEKLLAFGVHQKVVESLCGEFPGSAMIHGGVLGKKRQLALDRFNHDPDCRLLFGNVVAAGTGWSCKSASTVLFAEYSWVPADHLQAGDRIEGINRGVKGRHAHLIFPAAEDTIDGDLCRILERKQGQLSEVLDGSKGASLPVFDELTKAVLRRHRGKT